MDETIQPTQQSPRPESAKLLEEADYHRAEALETTRTARQLLEELKAQRPDGKLTPEDIADLKEIVKEAEGYSDTADQLDRQREAIAAGDIVTKAVTGDAAGNIITPREAEAVRANGPENGTASGGKAN